MPYKDKIAGNVSWSDVPTCFESGVKTDYVMLRGIFMPGGVTKDQVAYYVDVLKKVTESMLTSYPRTQLGLWTPNRAALRYKTSEIEGRDVRRLLSRLEGQPGVEHIAFFGTVLHVSGHDRNALENALRPLRGLEGYEIREAAPSLEDVFIHLQGVRAAA